MRVFARLSSVLAGVLLAVAPAIGQSSRPTVAVLDFDYGSIERWWVGTQDIGTGISSLLVDSLVDDGSFRVIERQKLDAILREQNFANSERADPSAKTLAQIGKVLGVKYLIVGTVTKFGTENSSKSVGGGAVAGRFGLGSVGKSDGKATVGLTVRVLDVTTAEIMISAKGDGTSKRSGLMLSGAGGGPGGLAGGSLDFRASGFRETIIGEATENAVKSVTVALLAKKDRLKN